MEDNNNMSGQDSASSDQVSGKTLKVEDVVEVEVTRITEFGAFVKLSNGKKGLIHISQISDSYVKNINDHLKVGDKIKARVSAISADGKIDLTLKIQKEARVASKDKRRHSSNNGGHREEASSYPRQKAFKSSSFEEKLKDFLKESEDRQTALRKHIEEKQGG